MKWLISIGTQDFINDEEIFIFIDALNYHLGHRKTMLMNSAYFILDSTSSNHLVLINEESAKNNDFELPNNSLEFASHVHQQIQNGYLNKPVQDIFMSLHEKRPAIQNHHFYMFEYDLDENKIISRDPRHNPIE